MPKKRTGPEVIKLFSCSTQMSTKFILHIIVGILTFISLINTTSERLKARYFFIGTRDLFNISYFRELYLFSKFLHFEEIVRVKMAVCFEMIVSET